MTVAELQHYAEVQTAAPAVPSTIEETGLAESVIEQLILKLLYHRNDLSGREISTAIGLKFSVLDDFLDALKRLHFVEVKRSLGIGNLSAQFSLTEAGRQQARESLEVNQYSGPAPVPIAQYRAVVHQQRPREGWLSKEALTAAYSRMVVTPRMFSQIGPAVSTGTSFLLYGQPGNGKTYLAEALFNLDTSCIYVPYAIECQGNIIQVYDPIYHQPINDDVPSASAIAIEPTSDGRWFKCRRPFIVSGGELNLEMLDLSYNVTSKVYDAPFQVKANNGIYLIDDFGRQKASPAEVLNRWIVPMERRIDYLTFHSGGKMTVPFEAFLIFSTNLAPEQLGDEAFLRRIQYKMLVPNPTEDEFIEIFKRFCSTRDLPYSEELIQSFIEKHYRNTGKPFRRCHPRDVLSHAISLIHFEKLAITLTGELLDRAFDSCFMDESLR